MGLWTKLIFISSTETFATNVFRLGLWHERAISPDLQICIVTLRTRPLGRAFQDHEPRTGR
jgi:hypothetical protein